MNALSTEMLKLAVDWLRQQIAEKLSPKKDEPSPEKEALDKIRSIMETFSPRYGEKVHLQEIYDAISVIIHGDVEPPSVLNEPTASRKPFQPNPITVEYVSNKAGQLWVWPHVVGPCGIWYDRNSQPSYALPNLFERIERWQKGEAGDLVILDSRLGYGYGATGFLVEDRGDEITLFLDDITTMKYRKAPKAAVLGYFRPKNTEKG